MKKGLPVMKCLPIVSLLLCLLMTTQVFAAGPNGKGGPDKSSQHDQSPASNSAYGGHWAAEQLNRWSKAGFFSVLANPVTSPNKPITRAEWAALVSELFGYKEMGTASYNDVAPDD